MFNNYEYQDIFLRSAKERAVLQSFLSANGIEMDKLDGYVGIFDGTTMIGGGGYYANVIKCVSILPQYRSEQLSNGLISHLRTKISANGCTNTIVFTKPEYEKAFNSLAFYTVGRSPNAVLLESNHKGIANYCKTLACYAHNGTNGVIVANCNPFTNGHKFLIETASRQVDTLHIIVVSEEQPPFTYADRLQMVKQGTKHIANVIVHSGSQYIISSATFPSYFIKDASAVARNQILLDLDIFAKHIAPALSASIRFVGSEPTDKATAQYNEVMKEVLPTHNIQVKQIERLACDNVPVSASRVRHFLQEDDYQQISLLVPQTTLQYLKELKNLT